MVCGTVGDYHRALALYQKAVTASTMYRDMGMTFWLKKAEATLGPSHPNSP
jgi:hypothetical protein